MKDNLAVVCSGACMIHCLLMPIVIGVSAVGVLGDWLASEWVHQLMLIPVVLLAALSLPGAYKKHKNQWPLLLAGVGISLLLSALFVAEALETLITVAGGCMLIIAHLWNRNLSLRFLLIQRGQANG